MVIDSGDTKIIVPAFKKQTSIRDKLRKQSRIMVSKRTFVNIEQENSKQTRRFRGCFKGHLIAN